MCGLVGFIPKKGKSGDLTKILPLMIMSEDRGTDGCGIAIGDQLWKGVGTMSKARDFINGNNETLGNIKPDFLVNKPIIAHTRKSTNGSHTWDNTHPFKWKSTKDESNYLVGQHNGVIYNTKKLKENFIKGECESLLKIDSHFILLGLYYNMDTPDEIELLKSYEGKANLMYYNSNSINIWKGSNGYLEDRSLYYIETSNGWYFCSIRAALYSLFPKHTIIDFPHGTLWKFKDFKLTVIPINRKTVIQTVVHTTPVREVVTEKFGNYNMYDDSQWNDHEELSGRRFFEQKTITTPVSTPTYKQLQASNTPVWLKFDPDTNGYMDKYTRKPITDGRWYTFRDPTKHTVDTLYPYNNISSTYFCVYVKDGILYNCKSLEEISEFEKSYNRLLHYRKTMSGNFAHNLSKLCNNIVVNYWVGYNRNSAYCVVFRDKDNLLHVVTRDNKTLNITPSIWNNEYTIKNINSELVITKTI